MRDYQLAFWMDECQKDGSAAGGEGCRFVMDNGVTTDFMEGCRVVSPQADAQRIDELISSGVHQVLLGTTALADSTLVTHSVARHGGERIGIWLPVRRTVASWGLDTSSNADFSVVSVTNPVPRWIVCMADGSPTDVDAQWWASEMIAAGVSAVVVSVIEPEDDDLVACAEMAEIAGDRFWLDTGSQEVEELRYWVRYGQVRQLLLPTGCNVTEIKLALHNRLARDENAVCSG